MNSKSRTPHAARGALLALLVLRCTEYTVSGVLLSQTNDNYDPSDDKPARYWRSRCTARRNWVGRTEDLVRVRRGCEQPQCQQRGAADTQPRWSTRCVYSWSIVIETIPCCVFPADAMHNSHVFLAQRELLTCFFLEMRHPQASSTAPVADCLTRVWLCQRQ